MKGKTTKFFGIIISLLVTLAILTVPVRPAMAATGPTVVTLAATDINTGFLVVNGNLTSMGSATAVTVSFEWGDSNFTWWNQTMVSTGPFSTYFTGRLQPGSYHFRAKAVGDGITAYGEDVTLFIAPSAGTGPATAVTTNSAILNGFTGYLNPEQLSYSLIWGTSPGGPYPYSTPQQILNWQTVFNTQITGLVSNTTYFYKAKVDYGSGISYGAESSFRTNSSVPTYKVVFELFGQLWFWDAAGSGLTSTTGTVPKLDPTWSRDGTKIAYRTLGGSGRPPEGMYFTSLDGGGSGFIADGYNPTFSPDGTKIAYESRADSGAYNPAIQVINFDGTGKTKLANGSHPDWSPDGTRIYYSARLSSTADLSEIYVMNSDGSNQTRLTNTPATELQVCTEPAVSPDNSKVVYIRKDLLGLRNGYDVYIMNSDGTNNIKLGNFAGATSPDWLPDGTGIAVASFIPDDTNYGIFLMKADGSDPHLLTYGDHPSIASSSSTPPASGNTTGTVASVPAPSGWPNEYNLYLNVTSTTVPGLTVGQQIWCAASTTDFPNLLTVGATLTGNLDKSPGWWVLTGNPLVPPPPAAGNTAGTVASAPAPSGAANQYNLYLNITSTTVPGLTVGQQIWCAASTTDFPNLLTVGATLTGNLDKSPGWWVLTDDAPVPPPPPATGNTAGTVASAPAPSGAANQYNLYLNISSTTVPGFTIGQQIWCAASTTDFPDLLTVGVTLTGNLDNSPGWWVFKKAN